ncbi:MAG TPA: hypothetical protein V6C81_09875 [Planktothrix sp.]|jgi:hypothetical protein
MSKQDSSGPSLWRSRKIKLLLWIGAIFLIVSAIDFADPRKAAEQEKAFRAKQGQLEGGQPRR